MKLGIVNRGYGLDRLNLCNNLANLAVGMVPCLNAGEVTYVAYPSCDPIGVDIFQDLFRATIGNNNALGNRRAPVALPQIADYIELMVKEGCGNLILLPTPSLCQPIVRYYAREKMGIPLDPEPIASMEATVFETNTSKIERVLARLEVSQEMPINA